MVEEERFISSGLPKSTTTTESYGSISQDLRANYPTEITHHKNIFFLSEMKVISKTASPLMLTFFLQYFLSVSPLLILSRVSTLALGSASLATMFSNITYLGIIQGCVTAVDSFGPQAYGAGNFHQVGESVQKNLVVNLLLLFPMVILCWNSEVVLNFLQPDKEIAKYAQVYLRIFTLGVPGLLIFELGKRFLQSQKIFHASTYALIIVSPLSIILTYILVFTYDLGFVGAPIVVVISYWLMALILITYIIFVDGKQCWGGFSRKSLFSNLYDQIYLSIFSLVAVEAEYIAFEVMSLASAYFGETQLAVQSLCSAIESLVFQIPFALGCAVATRVGQLIGSGDKEASIKSTRYLMIGSELLGIFNFGVLTMFMIPITAIFTNDPEVTKEIYKVLPLSFSMQFADCLNVTCAGLLRSQRKQDIGSVLNLAAYYLIGIPVAYYLAFVLNMQVVGLWAGLVLAVFILTIVEVFVLGKTNWDAVLQTAKNSTDEIDY